MLARRPILVLTAVLALLGSAGCGGGNAVVADETSDPYYQRAKDLDRQGRYGEALAAFRKVIDRRGEAGAPESHLEAGTLYMKWAKDPIEAYHHFGQFLELQPTGKKADMVRGQRDNARREVLKMFALTPGGGDQVRVNPGEDPDQLRRRILELQAEVETLRGAGGGGATSVAATPRPSPVPVISLGDEGAARETVAANEPAHAAPPAPQSAAPESSFVRTLSAPPRSSAPAQQRPANAEKAAAPTQSTPQRVIAAPTRPGQAPQRPAAAAGRSHTVTASEKSLWAIARRYYGAKPTAAQVQAIYQANRDVMRSDSDLRPGMVLRIP